MLNWEKFSLTSASTKKNKLDTKKSELTKIAVQLGDSFALDFKNISYKIESKKKMLQDHLKKNKEALKLAFSSILVTLEEAKQKFDLVAALEL